MSTVTIRIEGGPNLAAKMARLEAALTPERLEAAGIAGALKIVNAAKRNAPVVTGTLRRSIHVGGHAALTGGLGNAKDLGKGEMSAQRVNIRIGTDLEYAARIEYGFSGRDSLGRNYDQPPKPYLRPAFDEHKDEAIREVGAALVVLVKKALA
jgi:hypothetical protein